MSTWKDMRGSVVADTAYCDGVLGARDVAISLPAIKFLTYDFNVSGPMTVPIIGLLENMEAVITQIGADEGLFSMLIPKSSQYEFRWIQTVMRADGTAIEESCKVFLRAIPMILVPELAIEPGSAVEISIPLSVSRYELIINGKQVALIDRFKPTVKLNGVDYTKNWQNML